MTSPLETIAKTDGSRIKSEKSEKEGRAGKAKGGWTWACGRNLMWICNFYLDGTIYRFTLNSGCAFRRKGIAPAVPLQSSGNQHLKINVDAFSINFCLCLRHPKIINTILQDVSAGKQCLRKYGYIQFQTMATKIDVALHSRKTFCDCLEFESATLPHSLRWTCSALLLVDTKYHPCRVMVHVSSFLLWRSKH